MVIKPGDYGKCCHPQLFIVLTLIPSIMDYIMIERNLFDALVRGVRECRSALEKALPAIGCQRSG